MITVPTIDTQRLQLQPLSVQHSAGMFSMWAFQQVCEYSGEAHDFSGELITLPAHSPDDSDKIIDFFSQHQRLGNGFRWALVLKNTQQFVGALGFNSLAECAELAYHQHPEFWGKGFMAEAGGAALQWLRDSTHSTAAEAFIDDANVSSIKLIQRLGFVATTHYSEGARRYVRHSLPEVKVS